MADSNNMRIVILSAEAYPYVKVGGLGDVVGALPKYLEKLGLWVTVIIPGYRDIHHERHGIRPYEPLRRLDVPVGRGVETAEIFHTQLPGTSTEVFLIGSPTYFFRDGIYDDPGTREGFLDNMRTGTSGGN